LRKLLVAALIGYAVFVSASVALGYMLPQVIEVSNSVNDPARGGVLSDQFRILIIGWAVAMDVFVGVLGFGFVKRMFRARKKPDGVTT